jgi:hypothetical protein
MRYHYAASADPLKEHSTIEAVCGSEIPNAAFAALIDCEVVGYAFAMQSRRNMCVRCTQADYSKRFVYVIYNAQEARGARIA